LYLLDLSTAPKGYYQHCIQSVQFHAELCFHHIVSVFIQFGWLSNDPLVLKVYLGTVAVVLMMWNMNDGDGQGTHCYLTQRINEQCHLPVTQNLREWTYLLGLKKYRWFYYFQQVYMVWGIWDVCKKLKMF